MVATRATRSAGKRDASSATSSSAPDVASPVSKKAKTTPLPFKSSDLESKKKALNKVTPPKASPNTSRVPHPKKLEETKKKLKVVTTSVKTSVISIKMSKTLSNRALKRQQNKAKQQQQHHPETSPNEECWTSGVVGIIGGGISGLALALALQRKGIRSIVFEKDQSFEERAQGYGLTIQQALCVGVQAGRAMKALGLTDIVLKAGVASSSHFIFDNNGNVILFWGTTAASGADTWDPSRNCHVSRQTLRKSLLDALDEGFTRVIWGFDLENVDQASDKVVVSGFVKASSERVYLEFDLLAACDGIRSMVRTEVLQLNTPSDNGLRYLQSFVMLGIFNSGSFPILHNRMIQMSDGNARMFIMPFDEGRSMWQLSFRMSQETSAIALSKSGTTRLKEEAMRQCATFSTPILELIECTDVGLITGYPVYDREPLTLPVQYSSKFDRVTLLGDAAHPMSPFKGQG
ncbi:hypothetical protein BDR26DRAFT_918255, partial [Obelidium mucronatum]